MEESINNILAQLALAVETQSAANREREEAHDAKMVQIAEGLAALAVFCSANDNQVRDQPATSAKAQPEFNKQERRGGRALIEDSHIVDALTTDWITAGKLRKLLIARGITIAEGTVYNRMRKLVSERPNQVQATSKPERWRLRAPEETTSPAAPHVKSVVKRAIPQKQNLSIVPTARASIAPASSGIHCPMLHHGDCLEVMKSLPDDSVDLILADLPYGTTQLAIDERLNLDELWTEYRRILRKPHGNIVLFGSQPFTTALINAAPDIFRYSLVWDKNSSTGFQHAGSKPLKKHEDILVFSFGVNISEKRTDRRATFNDQHAVPVTRTAKGRTKVTFLKKAIRGYPKGHEYGGLKGCQNTVLTFAKDATKRGEKSHPFAKPIALLEHLIRTYSNTGEIVLDNTMGSGSTGVAAINAGRHFIGIEKDEGYFALATKRMENEIMPMAA